MDNRASKSKTRGAFSTDSQFQGQVRQYHVIINMITQMLAMDSLDQQLSLVLDTLTAGLGYQSAAVAFPDETLGSLDITKAVGFRDNAAARAMRIPLDSGLRHLESINRGKSARIARGIDELEDAFLDQIGSQQDLLAFPLFGGSPLTENELSALRKADFQLGLGIRGLDTQKAWTPAASYAVLYVTAPTDAMDEAMRADPTLEARLTSRIPLQRFGDPAADIGRVVAFLCSDAASYITGQTVVVDGGRFMGL